jgi:hypothetical protein
MRTLLMLRYVMLTTALVAGLMVKPPAVAAATPFALAPGENQFTVGPNSTCAIDTNHHLYCWGDNSGGTLGLKASVKFSQTPRRVGTGKWRSVHGDVTVCGIKWDHSVWCWGHSGAIGLSANDKYNSVRLTPQLIPTRAAISVERVSPNLGLCIRDRTLQLWCRLDDSVFFRQGWSLISARPVRMAVYMNDLICFVQTTNVMKCWGNNRFGTSPTGPGTPVRVKNPRTVMGSYQLILDDGYTCALDLEGYQRCWGKASKWPYTVPDRVADSWDSDHGVPCVDGLCVITPTKIEEVQWKSLWADQCGTLLDGEVSCLHEIKYVATRGTTVATLTLSDPFTDVKLGTSVGCGSKQDRTLWCWGLNDFRTDSVSGPRTFGRDLSDYSESPVQIQVSP